MTFLGKPNFPISLSNQFIITEPTLYMLFPLFFLGAGSAFFGYLTNDLF